jgi:DNA-binding transcriptional regulator YiaG
MDEHSPISERVKAALDELRRAYQQAADAITAADDAEAAFQGASELAEVMRQGADAAARLRAQMVRRIWESEQLSLAVLANRIGVSKARAAQIIDTTKEETGS